MHMTEMPSYRTFREFVVHPWHSRAGLLCFVLPDFQRCVVHPRHSRAGIHSVVLPDLPSYRTCHPAELAVLTDLALSPSQIDDFMHCLLSAVLDFDEVYASGRVFAFVIQAIPDYMMRTGGQIAVQKLAD